MLVGGTALALFDFDEHVSSWLRAYGKPHRVCTTGLIDHGTRKSLFQAGLTVVDVLATLRFFFESASVRAASI